MKWFFAGLLVVNIAFLAWNWQQSGRSDTAMSAPLVEPARNKQGLLLLSELNTLPDQRKQAEPIPIPPPQTEVKPLPDDLPAQGVPTSAPETNVAGNEPEQPTKAPVAGAPPMECLRLSPFESEAQARAAVSVLAQRGASDSKHGAEPSNRKRYWVLLPPSASNSAVAATVERLKKAGIKDYYLIRSGDNKNAISLGVFSSVDAAQRRYRQMRELKLKPRIDEIAAPSERWWVEFTWPRQRPENEWRVDLPKAAQNLSTQPCQ